MYSALLMIRDISLKLLKVKIEAHFPHFRVCWWTHKHQSYVDSAEGWIYLGRNDKHHLRRCLSAY